MATLVNVGITYRLRAAYTKSGIVSTVTPTPTVFRVANDGTETNLGAATLQNASGTFPMYVVDVTFASAGTHTIFMRTTDPAVDADIFSENVLATVASGASLTAADIWNYASRTLSANTLTVLQQGPDEDGQIVIIPGDTYQHAIGTAFQWQKSTWSAFNLNTAAWIRLYLQQGDATLQFTASGTAADVVRLELTAAQTSPLAPGTYRYDLVAQLSGGQVRTLVQAQASIPRVIR